MVQRLLPRLMAFLNRSGLSPTYRARLRLAARYLHGSGLEIGAMGHPLKVPAGVHVTYVDYMTKEENLSRYPWLDGDALVSAQLIEDGFILASVADASQDFLIANHVLEHATNPIQVLINWHRVLKPGGVLFISVPNGERCFDRDRPITTIEHLQDDFAAAQQGDAARSARMDREHYRQWLEFSIPRMCRDAGTPLAELTAAAKESRLEAMFSSREEIHYHVFSRKSLAGLFDHVISRYLADLQVVKLTAALSGAEFTMIARKLPPNR